MPLRPSPRRNGTRCAALALLPLAALPLACGAADEPAADAPSDPAWSVQLHVHGSFSEGLGSIDSHSHEAAALGVDAIWWSDHDFRIAGHQRVSRVGFEDWRRPLDAGELWTALERHPAKYLVPLAAGEGAEQAFVGAPVREGERSLRLALREPGEEWVRNAVALHTDRAAHRTSLAAGVEARLAVHAGAPSEDTLVFVRVELSEHAPREGLGLEPYALEYRLSSAGEPPWREGAVYHVPVAFEPGAWSELVLPISADAARGFDFVPQRDDALYGLRFGVASRRGAPSEACFDALRIDVERSGLGMYDVQREVLADVGRFHPEVVQLQGVEISWASRHLNEFSVDTQLLDYEALERAAPRDPDDAERVDERALRRRILEVAVDEAHARDGLVSYNHMFGSTMEGAEPARTREEQLALMLRNRAFGADLLEVGYRDRGGADLEDHLWVWDRMGLAGLRLVGIGVSDSHGGPAERWSGRPNNLLSWIYAPEPSKPALLAGLRAGRVFFGDIERFDGTLDLVTDRGWRMGQEVRTDRASTSVEVHVRGARPNDVVVVVAGGERVAELRLDGADATLRQEVALPLDADTLVRAELRGPDGEDRAFTNPIWFLRSVGDAGLDPARAGVDVGGVRTSQVAGVRIGEARVEGTGLALSLDAGDGPGSLALSFDDPARMGSARLDDLVGSLAAEPGRLLVSGLRGAGRLVVGAIDPGPASEATDG